MLAINHSDFNLVVYRQRSRRAFSTNRITPASHQRENVALTQLRSAIAGAEFL
jgi:hypothetical protein